MMKICQQKPRTIVGHVLIASVFGLASAPSLPADYSSAYVGFALTTNAQSAAKMAASILASESADDADGYPLPPAFLAGAGSPTGGGFIPAGSNAPKLDGTAARLGYCPWDNGAATAAGGRIAGSLSLSVPTMAVIAPGLDGTFSTTCADVLAGVGTAGNGAKGDDFVASYSTAQLRSLYSMYVGASVADMAALNDMAADALRDGEIRLVRSDNTLHRWDMDGEYWQPIVSMLQLDGQGSLSAGSINPASTGGNNFAIGYSALGANTTGSSNVALGDNALLRNEGGSNNIAVGYYAMLENITGSHNVAHGYRAMQNNTTGSYNSATGYRALSSNDTGSNNIANGNDALSFNVSGNYNIAAGSYALYSNAVGSHNIASGWQALYYTTGSHNIATGSNSLVFNTTGGNNIASGQMSLYSNTTGSGNVAQGFQAGYTSTPANANTTGSYNTFLGYDSGPGTSSQLGYATALGASARVTTNNTIVLGRTTDKTVIGATGAAAIDAQLQVTSGVYLAPRVNPVANLAAGLMNFDSATSRMYYYNGAGWVDMTPTSAGWSPDANNNLKAGTGAFAVNTTGTNNVATGTSALAANTSGFGNVASGYNALAANTTGGGNVATGYSALRSHNGFYAAAYGYQALSSNTSGGNNVGVGYQALFANTTGMANTATGFSAMAANVTGLYNSGYGYQALAWSTGNGNAAYGSNALGINSTGSFNVAVGYQSGITGVPANANTTGSNNTFLGYRAGPGSATQLSYATALGGGALVTTDNTIALGRTTDKTVIGATGAAAYDASLQVAGGLYLAPRANPAVNLAAGLMNFDTATNTMQYYNGTAWKDMTGGLWTQDANSNLKAGNSALAANTTGTLNVAIGSEAMLNNTGGWVNVAIGLRALRANTVGTWNVATGGDAMLSNTSGGWNVASGGMALTGNTTGDYNVAVGFGALQSNSVGSGNVAVGSGTMTGNTTGANNFAGGNDALKANTTGYGNVATGPGSLRSNTSADYNVATGFAALYSNTTGTRNVAMGYWAGYTEAGANANTTGSYNTFLGYAAGPGSPTQLNRATALGASALVTTDNTIVLGATTDKTVIGATGAAAYDASLQVTGGLFLSPRANPAASLTAGLLNYDSGTSKMYYYNGSGWKDMTSGIWSQDANLNLVAGAGALANNTTGRGTVAIGQGAALNMAAPGSDYGDGNGVMTRNLALGVDALRGSGVPANNTGVDNVAIGYQSLFSNTTGGENIAAGTYALLSNTTGGGNIALGWGAIGSNTTGDGNIASGRNVLGANTTGNYNIASSLYALSSNTTGSFNIASGYAALYSNTVGGHNVALGYKAGYTENALNANVSGSNNTFLGDASGPGSSAQLNYATALGAGALVTTDNTIALGAVTDKTVIGATGAATYDGKLQVTGGLYLAPRANPATNLAAGLLNYDSGTSKMYYYDGSAWKDMTSGSWSQDTNVNLAAGTGALVSNTTGRGTVAIGQSAAGNVTANGYDLGDGNGVMARNIAIGVDAMKGSVMPASNTGEDNIAVGYQALYSNKTGYENVANGNMALYSNINGGGNTAIGSYSLLDNTSGSSNVAQGVVALRKNTTGSYNVAQGASALRFNTSGNFNVAVGTLAGVTADSSNANLTGTQNTFLGYASGPGSATQINYATALGALALVTTDNTIVLGRTTDKTVIGDTGAAAYAAALQVTGGLFLAPRANPATNLAAGLLNYDSGTNKMHYYNGSAWKDMTSGWHPDVDGNLKAGVSALANVAGGLGNIAIGFESLATTVTGDDNLAVGYRALYLNTGGYSNIAMGYESLYSNTEGYSNIAIGSQALNSNTTGNGNVAMGEQALFSNTIGGSNIAMGPQALVMNTEGGNNIAFGSSALGSTTTGESNIAIGLDALYDNNTGDSNIAIGEGALAYSQGYNNVAIGSYSGLSLGSDAGSYNTYLGHSSGSGTSTALTYATALGADSRVATSNTIVLGRATDATVIGATGYVGTITTDSGRLQIGGSIAGAGITPQTDSTDASTGLDLGSSTYKWRYVYASQGTINTSDIRLKTNVSAIGAEEALRLLAGVPAIRYNWLSDPAGRLNLGTIAQEIQKVMPELVHVGNDKNQTLGVMYAQMTPILAAGITDLNKRVKVQESLLRLVGDDTLVLGRMTDVTVIGAGAADRSSSGYGRLQVNGSITPFNDNASNLGSSTKRWANVYAAGGLIQTSDARLKTNISAIDGAEAVRLVTQMNPVRYNWSNAKDGYARKIGFLAQEMVAVLPEVIHIPDSTNDFYGINYAELTVILASAVKKQQEVISLFSVSKGKTGAPVLTVNGMVEADVIKAKEVYAERVEADKIKTKELEADKIKAKNVVANRVISGEAALLTGNGCAPIFTMTVGAIYDVRAMSAQGGWGSIRIGLSAAGPVVQDRKMSDGMTGIELNVIGDQVCAFSSMAQQVNAGWLRVL